MWAKISEQREFFGDAYEEMIATLTAETSDIVDALALYLFERDYYPGKEEIDQINRWLHTLKGILGQCQLQTLAAMVHRIEDLFVQIKSGAVQMAPGTYPALVPFLRGTESVVRLLGSGELMS